MAQAAIGALRVTLAMDAGEFTRGLSKSEAMLARFGKRAQATGAMAARALGVLSIAGAAALGALSVAVKKTINDADKLAKLSQSVGVPVEQLSALKHAADLSGISLEQLANGVGRLSRNMADLAAGSGEEARRAFETMGIAVQNADGTLRSSSAVMGDVADRFAGMQDGAAKTAFAMQIFGRAGKEMIPLLNQGKAGIKEMTDEADALGLVIDTKTAKSAERFNDNLTRLAAVFRGMITQIAARMLPVLERFSEYIFGVAKSGTLLGRVSSGLIAVLRTVATTVAEGVLFFARLRAELMALHEAMSQTGPDRLVKAWAILKASGAETEAEFAKLRATLNDIFSAEGASGGIEFAKRFADAFKPIIIDTKAVTDALREQQAAMREGMGLYEQTRTPLEALAMEQARYSDLLKRGAIDTQTWARANSQAVAIAANAYAGLASDAAGALGKLFGESKAFAIAAAVINTAQAVTQSLAQYGATPFGLAAAAVAAAAGAAQIAAIRKTTKGGGGGGSAPVPSAASQPSGGPGQSRTIILSGLDSKKTYTAEEIRSFVESYNDFAGDGGVKLIAA
jgi:hypothetical protein